MKKNCYFFTHFGDVYVKSRFLNFLIARGVQLDNIVNPPGFGLCSGPSKRVQNVVGP